MSGHKRLRVSIAAFLTGMLSLLTAGVGHADDIYNNVDASIDATVEQMNLTAGGTHGSTTLLVDQTGWGRTPADGKSGCNFTGSTRLEVSVNTSAPAVATVSPTSLTFDSCSDSFVLDLTPRTAGTTHLTLTQTFNNTGATFNLAPAAFDVVVSAPPAPANTAPTLNLPAGAAAEATSASGAVVAYSATATDAEDDPDPTPLCSPASGGQFAIGATTVNCTVTDSGGLSANGSFTVTVSDTTAPVVSITTAAVTAPSGWYNLDSSGSAGVAGSVTATDAVGVTSLSCTDGGTALALGAGNTFTLGDGTHNLACSASDAAGTSGSANRQFKVDQTPPSMTAAYSQAPNGEGWNNDTSGVTLSYTCTDTTSGIDPAYGCPAEDTVTTDGLTTFHRSTADRAGNVITPSFTVKLDRGLPTITGSATPAANGYGWNNTDVAVAFNCFDAGSGIESCTGDTTLTAEGPGQSVTGNALDNAGNTNAATVGPINIDKTAPGISSARTPANTNGWNNGPVTVSFTCTDALSGIASGTAPVTLSSEGAGQSVTGTCTDKAGNSSSTTVSGINIDTTAPVITGSASPAANTNGWNNGAVTVSFSCAEAGSVQSGLDVDTVAGGVLSAEGAGQSMTNSGACTDLAGNAAASATVSGINIDTTAPVITGSASPAANTNGWNNGPVTVSFVCADALSGLDVNTVAGGVLSAEGAGQSMTNSGACIDLAGNAAASATVSGINIDATAPVVHVTGYNDGQVFWFGTPLPTAGCSWRDELSGFGTTSGPLMVDGRNAAGVGSVANTCSGTDLAGNTASETRTFAVQYARDGSGIRQPINPDNSSVFKRGQTVPVKFGLRYDEPAGFPTAGWTIQRVQVNCGTLADTTTTEEVGSGTPSSTFRYDATADQYIYNADFRNVAAGTCWKVVVDLRDGGPPLVSAVFKEK